MLRISEDGLKRLQAVKEYILAEPRRFTMSVIVANHNDLGCGTTCCIAGALLLLDGQSNPDRVRWSRDAGTLLGLDNPSATVPLFHASMWPQSYYVRFDQLGELGVYKDSTIRALCGDHPVKADMLRISMVSAEVATEARTHNAQLMAELIDEVCEKGGIWWWDSGVGRLS